MSRRRRRWKVRRVRRLGHVYALYVSRERMRAVLSGSDGSPPFTSAGAFLEALLRGDA